MNDIEDENRIKGNAALVCPSPIEPGPGFLWRRERVVLLKSLCKPEVQPAAEKCLGVLRKGYARPFLEERTKLLNRHTVFLRDAVLSSSKQGCEEQNVRGRSAAFLLLACRAKEVASRWFRNGLAKSSAGDLAVAPVLPFPTRCKTSTQASGRSLVNSNGKKLHWLGMLGERSAPKQRQKRSLDTPLPTRAKTVRHCTFASASRLSASTSVPRS